MDADVGFLPTAHLGVFAAVEGLFPGTNHINQINHLTSHANNATWLCTAPTGWQPMSNYVLNRCFVQGVLLQLPTLLMLTLGVWTVFALRRRKEITTTPRDESEAQKVRCFLQFVGSVVLSAILIIEAVQGAKFVRTGSEIAVLGPLLQLLSVFLAGVLAYLEIWKSTKPTAASLLFWWLFVAMQLMLLTGLVPPANGGGDLPSVGWAKKWTRWAGFITSLAVFLVEWQQPRRMRSDTRYENPYDRADLFSRLYFTWLTPVMRLGYEHFLSQEDLPPLASADRTDRCNAELSTHWQAELAARPDQPSLFRALLRSFGVRYFVGGGLCKFGQDVLAFAQPQLLRLLIAFVADYTASGGALPLTRGLYIAGGMFAVSAVQTLLLHQYFERAFGTGMNVRTAITNEIFRKSLVLSGEARATRTTGDTVNLMAIDTNRLQDVCQNGNMIWSGPLQIILCLYSLHRLVGRSMWIGVLLLVVMIPINSRLANRQKKLQIKLMRDKDLRTRLTSELLSSIKSIKLFAWESAFQAHLEDVRENHELRSLKDIGYFNAFMSYIWSFTPFLVSCSTFAFYVLVDRRPLTTEIVFPALALFNMLSFPMAVFPMLISSLIEANVAVKRITTFLTGETLQTDAVVRSAAASTIGEAGVELKHGTFVYRKQNAESGPWALHDVSFRANKGELTCVVGRVGSGKSSLLVSLLGETYKVGGEARVGGSIAYVAQNPWIFNGTLRDNILFGLKYDEELYSETLAACALHDDLAILPERDLSVVGEKGLSLSGGQKARLSLARAVYARADVYLLDDPLSAVDEHVGQHIIEHVLSKDGLLASKTVVLATNSIPVLQHADHLAMMVGGEIVEQGSLQAGTPQITQLLNEFGRKPTAKANEASSKASSKASSPTPESGAELATDAAAEEAEEEQEAEEEDEEPMQLDAPSSKRARRASTRRPSVASLAPAAGGGQKEHVERGKVSWDVYKEYANVAGLRRVVVFFFMLVASTGLSVGANVWLKRWADHNAVGGSSDVFYYLSIYIVLGSVSALLSVGQSLFLYVYIGVHAARQLHEKMLAAVIRAPMSFFETTPLGRIVNRFSNDVYKVDQQLARNFFMLFNNIVRVSFTIGIICYSTPSFVLLVIPLAYFYVYYQQYYLRTSRELKRLDSVSKSPIFNQFHETLDGIATVRAFGAVDLFNYLNRYFIDANNQAFSLSLSANRWLAVRLELVGSIVILAASGLAVLALPTGHIDAGLIGLALSYALQVTQSLNWIVRMTVEVETNIVSVERMMEYTALPSEAPSVIPEHRPPQQWPGQGRVALHGYSTRYRRELPLVLKDINLEIKAGEKIGIVGRTGAGKSSLTLALFRLIEADQGYVEIDDVRTNEIGLKDLRSRLSIIPQDSQLFQGTVRENLDPAKRYTDAELWRALELSHLKSHIGTMDGELEAQISEGGTNLSAGQRQLLSLARALLTDSKVLVLDEATAAVDVETDQLVQRVIREEFRDRTILTIAHRLNTIMDSDRVVVLGFGEVKEFAPPKELLADENSMFYALSKRGGIV